MQQDGFNVTAAMVTQRRKELGLPYIREPVHEKRVSVISRPDPLQIAAELVPGFNRLNLTLHGNRSV